MEMKVNKTKTQILKEIQDVVDEFNSKKKIIEELLIEIEELEKKYYILSLEIKNNK